MKAGKGKNRRGLQRLAAAAAILAAALGGCLKPGDGLGLTAIGTPIKPPDPCVLNPSFPGCPPVDSCQLPSPPPHCNVPKCDTLPKPVACLDRDVFTESVLPIFVGNCLDCHNPGGMAWSATELSLEADMAWDSLVNIPSRIMPKSRPMLRVKPGMPDSSFLYLKLTGKSPPAGYPMPLGRAPISAEDLLTIRQWITGK